ncbi:MAG: restriction endonuclease [Bacteroidota bacterium]
MVHGFTTKIQDVLRLYFGNDAAQIYQNSELLKYINRKTRSAEKGSKSRGSFGNLYAIYVLTEDYRAGGFHERGDYAKYEGARYSSLLKRQRELPFGAKLQNHALNQRMNQEFKKFFPLCEYVPIIRVTETKWYWINANLLIISANGKRFDISEAVLSIIDEYVATKKNAFETFIRNCEQLKTIETEDPDEIRAFINSLLQPNIDARIFEIVSYAILKYSYETQVIYWGYALTPDDDGKVEQLCKEHLALYKTGRTNANDGGIDFVMRPLGRFFQALSEIIIQSKVEFNYET